MVFVLVAFIIFLAIVGAITLFLSVRDSESWLVRRFTGHAPARVDEEELDAIEHDRAGDT